MSLSLSGLKRLFFQRAKNQLPTRNSTILLSSPNIPFDFEEAYKAARTNVIFSLTDKTEGCKTIVVTSAIPNEGKTTACLNLALSFAQTEAKVLVIDADLRKPKIDTYLNSENNIGLTNVLAGFNDIASATKKHPLGFDYLTSGHVPPNPVELLSSTKMTELLEELSKSYDYIFIDTPPVMIVTDALAIAKEATGVILVAKYMYTTRENLEKSISNLEFVGANILGIITNNTVSARRRAYKKTYNKRYYKYYRYYSYYGYEYSYGGRRRQSNEEDNALKK